MPTGHDQGSPLWGPEPPTRRRVPIAVMVVIGFALWVGAAAVCYRLARALA